LQGYPCPDNACAVQDECIASEEILRQVAEASMLQRSGLGAANQESASIALGEWMQSDPIFREIVCIAGEID
jgi:hypothetical protein